MLTYNVTTLNNLNMKPSFLITLFKATMFVALSVFSFSCDDDDDDKGPDCNSLFNQFDDKSQDFYTAWDEGDCEEMEDISNDLRDIMNEGKNCDNFEDYIVNELEYDSVDEFIDEMEDQIEIAMIDC